MRPADRARERPGGADRRDEERRTGLDRRGSQPRSAGESRVRAYGFREFRERRERQDRRLYGDGDCRPRRAESEGGGAGCFVYLTSEEIAVLLSEIDG
jgi:hypothetical protein